MASTFRGLRFACFLAATGATIAACSGDDSSGGAFPSGDGGADAAATGGSSGSGAGGGSADASNGAGGSGDGGGAGSSATGGTSGAGGAAGDGGGAGGSGGMSPTCSTDDDCVIGRCDTSESRCVECLFNNECAERETCREGSCEPPLECENSRDCRDQSDTLTICNDSNICVECAADADCGEGRVCAVSTCVESNACESDDDCTGGEICDTTQSQCVECLAGGVPDAGAGSDAGDGGASSGMCDSAEICVQGACRAECASDNDCITGDQLCDTDVGACADCIEDADCDSLEYCDNGTCEPDVCAQGVKSCIEGAVVECNENGSGTLEPMACGEDQTCENRDGEVGCVDPSEPDGGVLPAECNDGEMNGDETDVDCGGSCGDCAEGRTCETGEDCSSEVCEPSCSGLLCLPGTREQVCQGADCNDGQMNGNETDVDCGGSDCPQCEVGDSCDADSDCESNICAGGACEAADCDANLCPDCLLPTDSPCCLPDGDCGCAQTLPFPGACN